MQKIRLLLFVLVLGMLITPGLCADIVLVDEELYQYIDVVKHYEMTGSTSSGKQYLNSIYFKEGEDVINLKYMVINSQVYRPTLSIGEHIISATCFDSTFEIPVYVVDITKPSQITTYSYFFDFEESGLNDALVGHESQSGFISFNVSLDSLFGGRVIPADMNVYPYYPIGLINEFSYAVSKDWMNHIKIWTDNLGTYIDISREYEQPYSSTVKVYDSENNLITTNYGFNDVRLGFSPQFEIAKVEVVGDETLGGKTWTYYLTEEPEEPGEPGAENKTFTVFIRDGNTYNPIDEAEIAFKRYDTGAWALNKTVTGGSGTVALPKGWYYAYVNANGYYQPQPMQLSVDDNLVTATFNIYQIDGIPEPEEPTDFLDLTVSVKNSQTGALIGGSEIGIRRYGDTGFYQNLTLPSGYTTVFLPPGNYEIFAEAQGYYQVYPARITLDEPHENIGVFLQPITPIPEEGNVTLNLWVCYVERGSGQAVGIPYADILISGISGDGIGYSSGSLITDMGGYLTLDIPANTEYIAYAEKPGYLAGTTHFTVYDVSPVNMTIQMIREIPPTVPVVTPPPTIPTLPTPTEPLGFMEQSGKALGDLFGVSLSIGKMMLGVLISLAVGMGTAKNLKGGAPEFCVGFLGAAFLVTMADLIPVGFFVAMLLLMGIYIARAYFLGGENGG